MSARAPASSDYWAIEAYGRLVYGVTGRYIRPHQRMAAAEGAPVDVVFKGPSGWVSYKDTPREHREAVEGWAREHGVELTT